MARMTDEELEHLWANAGDQEVCGADLASTLVECRRARASEARLLEALKKIQFAACFEYECDQTMCPECQGYSPEYAADNNERMRVATPNAAPIIPGHLPSCSIANAIKAAEEWT